MTLAEYTRTSIRALIDSTSRQARHAERDNSGDAIHDLRVAIRRLSENLRVFEDLFPRGAAKQVRKELRQAMKLAGAARNHDIAAELMRMAQLPLEPGLAGKREQATAELAIVLHAWNSGRIARAWRERLHV